MNITTLFCGIGGTCLGFKNAGFNIDLAIDNDPYVINAYRLNFLHKAIIDDIRNIDFNILPDNDGIVASPPCQGFSVNGKQNPHDVRNQLLFVTAQLITLKNTKWFLIENVPNMDNEKYNNVTEPALKLLKLDYNIFKVKLNAKHLGVPQNRLRLIWFGIRKDITIHPSEIITNCDLCTENIKTVRDAIWHLKKDTEGDTNPSDDSKIRWSNLKTGERDKVSRRYKLDWDKPSYTLTAGVTSQRGTACWHIHPEHPRVITVKEGLLLSSFPENWILPDAKYRKLSAVGNAVPPKMAENIAKGILKIFK